MRTMSSTLRCLVAGSAIVVLSACSQTADVVMETPAPSGPAPVPMVDPARQAALQERLDAAEDALAAAQAALADAQAALTRTEPPLAGGSTPQQRQQALDAAREAVDELRTSLEAQPETDARRAATAALESVEGALTATQAALTAVESTLALAAAQADLAGVDAAAVDAEALRALESMETKVNEALAAVAAARTALEADPDPDVSAVLAQAQVTLGTAQASLVPVLRRELAMLPPLVLTQAQAAWTQARAGTAAAREDVVAKQKALAAATTKDQREAAAGELDTAANEFLMARQEERTAAAAYLREARAALEAATTDEQRRLATDAVAKAEAAEYAVRAWPATRIAAAAAAERFGPPPSNIGDSEFNVRVTGTPRKMEDETTANPAAAIKSEAVPYAAGKTVISPAATGDGDEFPLRALTLRGDVRQSYEGIAEDSVADPDNPPKTAVVQSSTSIDGTLVDGSMIEAFHAHYQRRVEGSMQLTADGMVMKTGGLGTVFGDFKRNLDRSTSSGMDGQGGNTDDCSGSSYDQEDCPDFNRDNLTLSFGEPFADPDDEPNYYWASRLGLRANQPQPDSEGSDGRRLAARGAIGGYQVWLSNHAGRDDDDDEHRYLSYAAYGLFVFTDYIDEYVRPGRLQALHFGYDAFRDQAGMMTNNESPSIAATFKGRTMGMILHPRTTSVGSEREPHVGSFTRLRGDVTLHACIGSGGCTGGDIPSGSNRIKGSITNLQAHQNGIWGEYRTAQASLESVTLMEDDIEPEGHYSGEARAPDHPREWNSGEYKGAFYGPKDAMETAGWWRLEPDTAAQNDHVGAFGSFGACRTAAQGGCGAPSN